MSSHLFFHLLVSPFANHELLLLVFSGEFKCHDWERLRYPNPDDLFFFLEVCGSFYTPLLLLLLSCSVVSGSANPCTVTHQALLSMRFPRQESWSGSPFPSPGALPDPGIQPTSPSLAGRFFTTEPPGKPKVLNTELYNYLFTCLPHL